MYTICITSSFGAGLRYLVGGGDARQLQVFHIRELRQESSQLASRRVGDTLERSRKHECATYRFDDLSVCVDIS